MWEISCNTFPLLTFHFGYACMAIRLLNVAGRDRAHSRQRWQGRAAKAERPDVRGYGWRSPGAAVEVERMKDRVVKTNDGLEELGQAICTLVTLVPVHPYAHAPRVPRVEENCFDRTTPNQIRSSPPVRPTSKCGEATEARSPKLKALDTDRAGRRDSNNTAVWPVWIVGDAKSEITAWADVKGRAVGTRLSRVTV